MPKKRKSRIYWRRGRAYGDFRDLGGRREALIPPGESRATTDPDVATQLAAERARELKERKAREEALGIRQDAALAEFAAHHLREKAREGRVTTGWLEESEHRLRRAVEYFGADRSLSLISAADVRDWSAWLARQSNGRGSTLTGGTVRHHLNALSNLYRRAQEDGAVPPGYNPVAALMVKPSAARREARWLEHHEAALVLEAARTYRPKKEHKATPWLYEIVATFLLTGGRKSEVLGLTVEDVSFDRATITFRPNAWRRLKTSTSHRSVPLWPQLHEILQRHIFERGIVSGLLFPSGQGGGMVRDLRKALDAVGERAGFGPAEIRTRMFRHTYTAASLQLLDKGAPISPWTVSKWLGHGGRSLVDRIYGHLGTVRHRSEVLEFRVENHRDELEGRLEALVG